MRKHTDSVFEKFAKNTTLHGPGNISRATQKWLKIVWSLSLLSSFSVFIWQASSLVQEYFTYPVSTSGFIIRQTETFFPTVTVCNQNPAKSSLIHQNDETRLRDLASINNLFQGCKEILYSDDGFKTVFASDLGFNCKNDTTVLKNITTLQECLEFYWFDKLDEVKLKFENKTEYEELVQERADSCRIGSRAQRFFFISKCDPFF